ncbi:hypothetical protein L798_12452 [Zootermopsis nevadensis]|uniref:Uncharacterized protein n=1 Tax=Zootermopsis nevadensis TaxID=136037 RepID=A0A067QTZ6_ZOONE|nr:hypothetical protein L798_12452 [Zootermopsis nevadensis]
MKHLALFYGIIHKAPANITLPLPTYPTCLSLLNWGSSKRDYNPAWHPTYLAELTIGSAGLSYCQLPNVFQGFSSPSKNGRENKIYSNSKTMFSLQHIHQLAKNVNKCYTM